MHTIVVGLSIKRAPLEILEQLSVHHSQNELCVQDVKAAAGLAGAVVLSTCNRLEFYGATSSWARGARPMRPRRGSSASFCTPSRTGAPCATCSRSCAA